MSFLLINFVVIYMNVGSLRLLVESRFQILWDVCFMDLRLFIWILECDSERVFLFIV